MVTENGGNEVKYFILFLGGTRKERKEERKRRVIGRQFL